MCVCVCVCVCVRARACVCVYCPGQHILVCNIIVFLVALRFTSFSLFMPLYPDLRTDHYTLYIRTYIHTVDALDQH